MKTIRLMKTKTIILFILLALCLNPAAAQDFPKNPNIADARSFVADPANMLSPETKAEVNRRLHGFRQGTSAEMAVAVVPEIGDMSIEEYSTELFRQWGLGKADNDNGILLVISTGARKARIETGYGVEGAMPDAVASRIIQKDVVANMKTGNLDAAVNSATADMVRVLSDPAYAEELQSRQRGNASGVKALDSDVIMQFLWIIGGIAFVFALFLFGSDLLGGRKKSNFDKSQTWAKHIPVYWICAIASCGAALAFALLALWLKGHYRRKPVRCDTCGAKMHRLGEEEDNELLNPSQDLEERLDTVDYDVWECRKCGTIERFAFPKKQNIYTPCPHCGTVANHLVLDKITVPATTRHPGKGEKTFKCEYCPHQTRPPYVIPRKEDGALLAAAALGAIAGSRGSRGGDGFGGGFGGGSSGGGGASGGW